MLLVKLINLDPARINKIAWILEQGIVNHNTWLAGGALRTLIDQNETICDYDLFFSRNKISMENGIVSTKYKLEELGFKLTYQCPEGKLYTYEKIVKTFNGFVKEGSGRETFIYKVQLITEHFYSSPEELLSTFDLSPTYFCTDGEYLWTSRQAIRSVKKKVCSLLKLSYPVSTFNRIIKYCGKGYSCIPAIETYIGSLLDSNREVFTSESMRRYID